MTPAQFYKAYRRVLELHEQVKALAKSGPYVGPRGGLWKDPEHTQHWDGAAEATPSTPEGYPDADFYRACHEALPERTRKVVDLIVKRRPQWGDPRRAGDECDVASGMLVAALEKKGELTATVRAYGTDDDSGELFEVGGGTSTLVPEPLEQLLDGGAGESHYIVSVAAPNVNGRRGTIFIDLTARQYNPRAPFPMVYVVDRSGRPAQPWW